MPMRRWLLLLLLLLVAVPVRAQSTTEGWIPSRPDTAAPQGWLGTNLVCFAWPANFTMTGATQIAFFITTGMGAAQTCSWSIYTAESVGGNLLATTGALDCSTSGVKLGTGITPFAINKGTKYQVCTCATATGGAAYMAQSNGFGGSTFDFQAALSNPIAYGANNACTGSTPPATTGGLAGGGSAMGPILLVATNTP
jgi:hypothetical protein